LQALSRRLASAADVGQVLLAARDAFKRALGLDAWLRIGTNDSMSPGVPPPDEKALAAADWCQANQQPAGRYTDTLASSDWWFLPVSGEREAIGVVGLRLGEGAPRPGEEQRRLAEAMTQEIGQAVVRTRLVEDLEDTRVAGETERLRSALLSSVSHDLRSPLSSILGAAGTLDAYGAGMDAADHHALLDTIRLEGERLDRYIQNLLDMTRLGHGDMTLRRDWIGVDELVGSAVARLVRYQARARAEVRIPADLAPIWVHPALVEQAVFNVLENAARFSPPEESVLVEARDAGGAVQVDVVDRGPGIPADERRRVFDMFYSVERGDRGGGRQGTGLGLAIAQGMVGAHGGSVEALPGDDGRGTRIRITLPRMTPAGSES
jgi:two-component system sensor histidine kinase KdpD